MADETYDLRSNIKGKPGSQGTLFQVKDKGLLNPQQRWPKGYTPERQREVNDALGYHGTGEFYVSDKAGTGPERREMNETIKRSTVPAEHLGGVRFTPGQQSIGSEGRHTVTLGIYEATAQPESRISVLKGHASDDTVIHEIGHHVSYNEATEHSQYRTPQQQGKEESFADNYAYEHFRDRRGQRMADMRIYPTPENPDQNHRQNFAMAYHRGRNPEIPSPDAISQLERKRTPQQQAFVDAKTAESQGETLFTTWDNGDRVGFHAPSSKPYQTGEEIGHTPKGKRRD